MKHLCNIFILHVKIPYCPFWDSNSLLLFARWQHWSRRKYMRSSDCSVVHLLLTPPISRVYRVDNCVSCYVTAQYNRRLQQQQHQRRRCLRRPQCCWRTDSLRNYLPWRYATRSVNVIESVGVLWRCCWWCSRYVKSTGVKWLPPVITRRSSLSHKPATRSSVGRQFDVSITIVITLSVI